MKGKYFVALVVFSLFSLFCYSQLNVTLSGGGVKGFMHLGVLKLLEDNNARVHSIGGSSVGALIGALYASGYNIDEIANMLLAEETVLASQGKFLDKYYSNFYDLNNGQEYFNITFSNLNSLFSLLPVSLNSSVPLQFILIDKFSSVDRYTNGRHDSLLIPLRVTASEIQTKKLFAFKQGNLAENLRASLSFPIYFKSINLYDSLLFLDGGMYNNLPIDIMVNAFKPKKIIASSVVFKVPKATPDNLISQIIALTTKDYDSKIPDGIEGFIINHNTSNVGTFEFENSQKVLYKGIEEVKEFIPEFLKLNVFNSDTNFKYLRNNFIKNSRSSVWYNNIKFLGSDKNQNRYLEALLKPSKKNWNLEDFKKKYVRLFSDYRFHEIDFVSQYNQSDSFFSIIVNNKPIKSFAFFANISSLNGTPGNLFELFLGGRYNFFVHKSLISNELNFSLGNFQLSVEDKLRIDLVYPLVSFIKIGAKYFRNDYLHHQDKIGRASW